MADVEERFWAKVDKNGPLHPRLGTRCWIWTACTSARTGYGQFTVNGDRREMAHRFSYELCMRQSVEHIELDHRCHRHACVNPYHLRPSTRKQNMENRQGLNANNKSGVRGVSWDQRRSRWFAKVQHSSKQYFVGYFISLAAAEAAIIAKRNEFFTHNDLDRAG